jgi:3-deoxy-7-phosphoheptulonate synthase
MREPLENRNITAVQPLVAPAELKRRLPAPEAAGALVRATRAALRDVLHGRDPRCVVVVGPCSIHDPDAAIEYARRLAALAASLSDTLLVLMRTYFEKPRTTVGWKGLVNDPHLDGSRDVATGLERARRLLLDVHAEGLACASELLDPVTPQYIADLLSWAAIGARTTESQTHRELASGLSMPVGFKNATDGSVESAVNAMTAAAHAQAFLGVDARGRASVLHTRGNPDRHLVLRGGRSGPNYAARHVRAAAGLADREAIARPVMVDCSHENSGKDHTRQAVALRDVAAQIRGGEPALFGVLIESNLEAGRQTLVPGEPLRRGVSITDACIGFEETAVLLHELADATREGRGIGRAREAARA